MMVKITMETLREKTNRSLYEVFLAIAEQKPFFFLGHECRYDYLLDLDYLNYCVELICDPDIKELAKSIFLIISYLDIPEGTEYILFKE